MSPSRAAQDPRPRVPLLVALMVRWSGLLMAAGLAVAGMWVEVAVALLVALGQVLAWQTQLPWRWEVACSVTALIAAVSSYLELYTRLGWWDVPVHFALNGLLAVMAARVLSRSRPSLAGVVAIGVGLAVVWEVMEQLGHDHIDPAIYVAPWDTAGDVAVGMLGSVVAAWLYARTADRWFFVGRAPAGPVLNAVS